ncbi:hypothetical protein GCM10018779_14320 [Streptomyces griseocarneus]|nr:hypothetical protein GCM10018779_14320 [Streptomyces griseocarneus]
MQAAAASERVLVSRTDQIQASIRTGVPSSVSMPALYDRAVTAPPGRRPAPRRRERPRAVGAAVAGYR